MAEEARSRTFYGWYVAGCAVLVYFFTNGLTIHIPQNLAPRYMEDFGVTEGAVSLPLAITLLVAAFVAPFVGGLVDRYGVLRVIRVGLILLGLLVSVYPFAGSMQHIYLLHAGAGLGLVLCGLMTNVILLSNWFVRRRGAVVGLLVAGSSLAGAILPVAISPLVNDPALGWRWGYGSLAMAFWVLAVIPGFLIMRSQPSSMGQLPDGDAAPSPATEKKLATGVSFRKALGTRTLWCLALGSACLWFCITGVTSQSTIFFEQEAGMTPEQATVMFAVIFWLSVAGKFAFGAVADRVASRRVMATAAALLFAGCLLLFRPGGPEGVQLTTSTLGLVLFSVVFGLGFGGSFTLIQLTCVETFGHKSLGKILGIINMVDPIGGALGPVVAGQLRTATGSYFIPFLVITGVALVAVINVFLIRPVEPD